MGAAWSAARRFFERLLTKKQWCHPRLWEGCLVKTRRGSGLDPTWQSQPSRRLAVVILIAAAAWWAAGGLGQAVVIDESCYWGWMAPTYSGPLNGSVIRSDHLCTYGIVAIDLTYRNCPVPATVQVKCWQQLWCAAGGLWYSAPRHAEHTFTCPYEHWSDLSWGVGPFYPSVCDPPWPSRAYYGQTKCKIALESDAHPWPPAQFSVYPVCE